jgi:cbb3-type cytochrome oxidase subunit 3
LSTKKIILIVLGVVAVLCLIVALFAGGIVWFVFRTISTSDAAEAARVYLKNNETLKQDIGEVKDFGYFVTGQLNRQNDSGEATLHFKVIGETKTVNATVDLAYRSNRGWRVTNAFYDRDGKTVELMQPYEALPSPSP